MKHKNESPNSRRAIIASLFLVITICSLILTTNLTVVISNLHDKFFDSNSAQTPLGPNKPSTPKRPRPPPDFSSEPLIDSDGYSQYSCNTLDTPFQFESPPDFTKLSIESWTDCKPMVSLNGWKVDHCTAAGSTWPNYQHGLEKNSTLLDSPYTFLPRAKPTPEGQQYQYMSPPQTFSVPLSSPPPCPNNNCTNVYPKPYPTRCNPSGYFRVQRLDVPVTNYTDGSAPADPSARCRNSRIPISPDQSTRRYIEDFAGPDIIQVYLNGPERYMTDQQINLGNCTYAIPYVLSRPGRFWVTRIVHAYHDYQALNENFAPIPGFVPKYLGVDILPSVPQPPPNIVLENATTDLEREAIEAYNSELSNIHSFMVCERCTQFVNPAKSTKHQDLPICSFAPSDAFREYGVHTGIDSIQNLSSIESQEYVWVASRPSCRHVPELYTLLDANNNTEYSKYEQSTPVAKPLYGSPPNLPRFEKFSRQHNETKRCLSNPRHIYYAGDSHMRQIFSGLINALIGIRSDQLSFTGWGTHLQNIDGLQMRQDFDNWFFMIQNKLRFMLGKDPLHDTDEFEEWDLLKDYDTIVLDYGAWPMAGFSVGTALTTEQFFAQMKPIIWDLAAVRFNRQEHYKKTGEGFPDLRIIWLGQVPWPDTRLDPDMRTNPKLILWDNIVGEEIQRVNDHYQEQGGMIDRISYISKAMPYRQLSADQAHHTDHHIVDAVVQAIIHKLDLCKLDNRPYVNQED